MEAFHDVQGALVVRPDAQHVAEELGHLVEHALGARPDLQLAVRPELVHVGGTLLGVGQLLEGVGLLGQQVAHLLHDRRAVGGLLQHADHLGVAGVAQLGEEPVQALVERRGHRVQCVDADADQVVGLQALELAGVQDAGRDRLDLRAQHLLDVLAHLVHAPHAAGRRVHALRTHAGDALCAQFSVSTTWVPACVPPEHDGRRLYAEFRRVISQHSQERAVVLCREQSVLVFRILRRFTLGVWVHLNIVEVVCVCLIGVGVIDRSVHPDFPAPILVLE